MAGCSLGLITHDNNTATLTFRLWLLFVIVCGKFIQFEIMSSTSTAKFTSVEESLNNHLPEEEKKEVLRILYGNPCTLVFYH